MGFFDEKKKKKSPALSLKVNTKTNHNIVTEPAFKNIWLDWTWTFTLVHDSCQKMCQNIASVALFLHHVQLTRNTWLIKLCACACVCGSVRVCLWICVFVCVCVGVWRAPPCCSSLSLVFTTPCSPSHLKMSARGSGWSLNWDWDPSRYAWTSGFHRRELRDDEWGNTIVGLIIWVKQNKTGSQDVVFTDGTLQLLDSEVDILKTFTSFCPSELSSHDTLGHSF